MTETSIYATCPFWVKDKDKSIKCETIIDMDLNNSRTILAFRESSKCDEFKRKHCYHMNNYKQCPLYKALWSKYDEVINEDSTNS